MRLLAGQVRGQYDLQTPRVLKSDLRRIYRDQGIHIDLWPYKLKKLRGAYFNDDPMIFTMGHELKHHLVDRDSIVALCDTSNQSAEIEIGAEIFAAELIYPEQMFCNDLIGLGVTMGSCKAEQLVALKRETKTTLSYAGIAKRAEFLGFAPQRSLMKVAWKKLEENIYGVPLYKQRLAQRASNLR